MRFIFYLFVQHKKYNSKNRYISRKIFDFLAIELDFLFKFFSYFIEKIVINNLQKI